VSQNTAQNAFSSAKKEGLKTQKVLAPYSPEGDTQTPYFTALDDTEGPKCGPMGEILESILSNLECLKTVLGVTETANYETEAER